MTRRMGLVGLALALCGCALIPNLRLHEQAQAAQREKLEVYFPVAEIRTAKFQPHERGRPEWESRIEYSAWANGLYKDVVAEIRLRSASKLLGSHKLIAAAEDAKSGRSYHELQFPADELSAGVYTLEAVQGETVLARQQFSLVPMPLLGGQTALVVDPSARAFTAYVAPNRFTVWIPVDARRESRLITFSAFADGELVATETSATRGVSLRHDGGWPIFDIVPAEFKTQRLNKDKPVHWQYVAVLDGKVLLGSWEFDTNYVNEVKYPEISIERGFYVFSGIAPAFHGRWNDLGAPPRKETVSPAVWAVASKGGRVELAKEAPRMYAPELVCAVTKDKKALDIFLTKITSRAALFAQEYTVIASDKVLASEDSSDRQRRRAVRNRQEARETQARAVTHGSDAEKALARVVKSYKSDCLRELVPAALLLEQPAPPTP